MNLPLFTRPTITPVPMPALFSLSGPAVAEPGKAGLFEALCATPPPVVEASVAVVPLPVAAVGVEDATAMVATLDRSVALLPGASVAMPQKPPVQTQSRIATAVPPTPESGLPAQDSDEACSPNARSVSQAQPMRSFVHLRSPERSLALGNVRVADRPTLSDTETTAPLCHDEPLVPDPSGLAQPAPASLPVVSAALFSAHAAPPPAFTPVAGSSPVDKSGSSSDAMQQAVAAPSANAPDTAPITLLTNPVAVQPAPDFALVLAPSIMPATATVDRHLDLARGDAWLDDLARDIAASAVRGGYLKFALAPETLGRLDVEVRRGGDGVSIHMAARNETARDVLNTAQPRLIEEIRAQGVRVTGSEVSAGTTDARDDRAPRPQLQSLIEAAPVVAATETPTSATSGRYA